jgi:hypothetical protein
MKRILLVLLSLGMVTVFSATAMAVDVKFSGEFYAAGLYQDKTTFMKGTASDGPSTAFYFQRLRVRTDFIVSPGLRLTTRADIMERAWGATRSTPGTTLDNLSAATRAENENIGFDLAYVEYISPIGLFSVGYQNNGAWGTVFGDNTHPAGKVAWMFMSGGFYAGLQAGKNSENSRTAINQVTTASDRDNDFYYAWSLYTFKNGQVGVLYSYVRNAAARAILNPNTGFTTNVHTLLPYANVKFGPVAIQAEVNYIWGDVMRWDGDLSFLANTRGEQWTGWIDATADFGPAYVGGTVAYVEGQDPGTTAITGGLINGGQDWKPCLIMWNSDRNYWAGAIPGYGAATLGAPMTNAWFFQGRAGVRPVDKLDIMASVSYATADKKPTATWLYNDYGWEVDLTATYKITNNLSYMVGGGYMFTGKFFKADQLTNNDLNDNYMVINKLTLTF